MEEGSLQTSASQLNYQSPTSKKPKKFLYLILFVIFLPIVIFGIQKVFFNSKAETEVPATTPTPTEFQFPTDTPAPTLEPDDEEEEEAEPTVSPTSKKVDPVDSETGLDRSTLSVEVQNGSGEVGAAGQAADILKDFGYEISSTGNADNYDYEDTTIQVKSTKVNFLPLLKKDLGFSYTVGSTSSDLDSSSTADALVIIGK